MPVGADPPDLAEPDAGAARAGRTRVMQRVREARETLTSGGLRPAFTQELVRQLAQTRRTAAPLVIAMVLAVPAISSLWLGTGFLVPWLIVMLAAQGFVVLLARQFVEREGAALAGAVQAAGPPRKSLSGLEAPRPDAPGPDAPRSEPPRQGPAPSDPSRTGRLWGRRMALAELPCSLAWAVLAWQLVALPVDAARLFGLFVSILVVALSTVLAATVPPVLYAGALPVALTVLAGTAHAGGATGSTLAAMAAGSLFYFMLLGERLRGSAVATLEFRAEKDALIAELEQAKANSDEARRRAEEANLAKSRFLATMSHELRTPLNAILGFSEVMKSEVFGPLTVPNYKEYVGDIHASGQHLLGLINEILDLSRIEAGRYELSESAVRLVHIADDCQHLLLMRAKSKGIAIREAFETGLPALWADERAIRQVVLNLLSNAIKFTPQGGEITVKIGWTASGGQYLSIKDTGPGIPEHEIPIVLSSFGRGSLALKTAEQGTGLGLPIVKGLVDMHGGRFTLRSKLREGTEAMVAFPAERVMEPLAPVIEGQPGRPKARAPGRAA